MSEARPHLLVVDDEQSIRDPLTDYLERNGFRASRAASAKEARRLLAAYAIDLVVLDVMMPGEDGLSLARPLRWPTAAAAAYRPAPPGASAGGGAGRRTRTDREL